MLFKNYHTDTKLKDYILFYFELDWRRKKTDDDIKYLCLPTGCSFIGFQRKGRMRVQIADAWYKTEKYYVNSQTTVPYFMTTDDRDLNVLVVCLKPTALHHLFKINVSKIINTGINPKELMYHSLTEEREHLLLSSNMEESIKVLDKIFLEQVEIAKPKFNFIDYSIEMIHISKGNISENEIVEKLNVSKRYFQKKFKEMVGIPPKKYIKIIKFNYVFSKFKEIDTADCKSILADFDFYDSAHYSNSFKKLMGLSPSEFNPELFPFIQLTTIEKEVWIRPFVHD